MMVQENQEYNQQLNQPIKSLNRFKHVVFKISLDLKAFVKKRNLGVTTLQRLNAKGVVTQGAPVRKLKAYLYIN